MLIGVLAYFILPANNPKSKVEKGNKELTKFKKLKAKNQNVKPVNETLFNLIFTKEHKKTKNEKPG